VTELGGPVVVTADDGIKAAMAVARDIAEGRVLPAQLEVSAAGKARALFGRVVGPGDPLWELQVDVCRQVLAVGGGIPVGELAEWVAVYRAADAEVVVPAPGVAGRGPSWIEAALAQDLGADAEV
jgi:hypothetical protein